MRYLNYLLPISLVISQMSFADESSQSPDIVKCETPYHAMHIGLRHTEARGVGYSNGYTTLQGFGIYNRSTGFMPFLDLRGHVFDDGKFAGNIGVGGRTWLSSVQHVLGYYVYYDVRQHHHRLTPQQVSPGIELLGKRMEYRMNGYFPVGTDRSRRYGYDFDSFHGNRILLKHKQLRVLTGGDAEIGAHITQSAKFDLYAGAGPYYFSASHASSWGGKARLLGRYKEYISLEASYSYDHLFRSIVQGSVALNLPLGKKLNYKEKGCRSKNDLALSRAAFAPYRFEIPVVKRTHIKQKAINPATGDPWKVWFVDNTSSSQGTYESPFPTLFQAEYASAPNDIIYVFPGDGTTTGMDMGIALQNNQDLFGSGITHTISTTKGNIKIPAFSGSSPVITNTPGSVVTLANGNEVSGFQIMVRSAGFYGIDGSSGIIGADINNNSFFGSVDYSGIHIIGQGDVDVKYNQLINSVSQASTTGISFFVSNETFMDANISDNIVSGFNLLGIFFSPQRNFASAQVLIARNSISNFGSGGIYSPTGMPNSTVQILNNTVLDNAGRNMGPIGTSQGAIVASVNNAPDSGTVIIDGNTVFTPTSSPQQFGITAQINLPTGANFKAVVTNNTVYTGSGTGSVGMNLFSRGNLCATVSGNQIYSQAASGTTDLNISTVGASSVINLNDLSNNVAENVTISGLGTVNIAPCGE
jgi:hypothetical protein